MTERRLWQIPALRTDSHHERKVTWLELFYDLVFVVIISQLAHKLVTGDPVASLGGFILLFIPVWWVWIGSTFYTERFETDGLETRLIFFLKMIPVAGLAIFIRGGLGETSAGFALSYAAARGIITLLWLRATIHVVEFRPVGVRYVAGFTLSFLLFISSVLVDPPLRFAFWAAGLLLDLVTPATTLAAQAKLPRFNTSKLPERFGLLVLIVLGESVVGVVSGVAEGGEFSHLTAGRGVLGLAVGFGLWWVYFDNVARRPPRAGVLRAFSWSYLHLPLVMGIAATGASITNVLAQHEALVPPPVAAVMAGSVGCSLLAIGILETLLHRAPDEPTHTTVSPGLKLACGALALALAVSGAPIEPVALLGSLFLLLLVQIAYGTSVWFRRPRAAA